MNQERFAKIYFIGEIAESKNRLAITLITYKSIIKILSWYSTYLQTKLSDIHFDMVCDLYLFILLFHITRLRIIGNSPGGFWINVWHKAANAPGSIWPFRENGDIAKFPKWIFLEKFIIPPVAQKHVRHRLILKGPARVIGIFFKTSVRL